jgi:hypothetical protein
MKFYAQCASTSKLIQMDVITTDRGRGEEVIKLERARLSCVNIVSFDDRRSIIVCYNILIVSALNVIIIIITILITRFKLYCFENNFHFYGII